MYGTNNRHASLVFYHEEVHVALPPYFDTISTITSHEPAIPIIGDIIYGALPIAARLELIIGANIPVLGEVRSGAFRDGWRGRGNDDDRIVPDALSDNIIARTGCQIGTFGDATSHEEAEADAGEALRGLTITTHSLFCEGAISDDVVLACGARRGGSVAARGGRRHRRTIPEVPAHRNPDNRRVTDRLLAEPCGAGAIDTVDDANRHRGGLNVPDRTTVVCDDAASKVRSADDILDVEVTVGAVVGEYVQLLTDVQ